MQIFHLVSPQPSSRSDFGADPSRASRSSDDFAAVYGQRDGGSPPSRAAETPADSAQVRPGKKDDGESRAKTEDSAQGETVGVGEAEDQAELALSPPMAAQVPVPEVPAEVVEESGAIATAAAVPEEGASVPAVTGEEPEVQPESVRTVPRTETGADRRISLRDAVLAADRSAPVPVSKAAAEVGSPTVHQGAEGPAVGREPPAPLQVAAPGGAQQVAPARSPLTDEVTVRRVLADAPVEPDIAVAAESAPARPKPPTLAATSAASADPTQKVAAELALPDSIDPAALEAAPTEGRTTADHAARAEATVKHDTPRAVMQQVAEAARALRDGPVELTLKPEELGKVKLTLSTGADGSMNFVVQTERPETLDLLRRNIGDLARELQSMGFENLSFSFGQDRPSAEHQHESPASIDAADPVVASIPMVQPGFPARPASSGSVGGLDLRL